MVDWSVINLITNRGWRRFTLGEFCFGQQADSAAQRGDGHELPGQAWRCAATAAGPEQPPGSQSGVCAAGTAILPCGGREGLVG